MENQTQEHQSAQAVLGELARLDKIVRDFEHSILIAERLKARGCWHSKWDVELELMRDKLARMLRERHWFDGAISRYASSPNRTDQTAGENPA